MPDVTTMDTTELYDEVKGWMASNPLTQYQTEVLDELTNRIIKENDDDDIRIGGLETTKGGIRPNHVPLVP